MLRYSPFSAFRFRDIAYCVGESMPRLYSYQYEEYEIKTNPSSKVGIEPTSRRVYRQILYLCATTDPYISSLITICLILKRLKAPQGTITNLFDIHIVYYITIHIFTYTNTIIIYTYILNNMQKKLYLLNLIQ